NNQAQGTINLTLRLDPPSNTQSSITVKDFTQNGITFPEATVELPESQDLVFTYKDLIADHNLIQETKTTDSDGFATAYENINEVLSISEIGIGLIEEGVITNAYLHMQKEFEFDHDTFVIRSDSTGNYRLKITPEDISLFNSNILAEVYAPYGD